MREVNREMARDKHYYYCYSHRHPEWLYQVYTTERSPLCPDCEAVMTYGRGTNRIKAGRVRIKE